jgi:thiol-disulfide isomerase/thioredoxin
MNMERAALDSESVHSSYMMDASLTMEDKRMRENATLAQFHYTIAKLAMRLDQQDTALRHIVEALRMVHAKDPEIISATLHMIIAMAKKMPMIGGMLPMVTTGAASNDTLWQLVEEAYKQFDHPPVSIDQMREMARNMRENSREAAFCRNIYRAVAPNIALPSLDQGFLDSLPKGKVIVLDFWGTWCTPCAITLPKLDSVYQQFKKNDDVRFYAIDCLEKTSSLDTLKPMVKDFLQRSGVTIPVLFDTAGAIVKSYDILFYPTRVVIDKKGIIRVWEVSYPEENIKDIVPFEIKELLDDACNKQP